MNGVRKPKPRCAYCTKPAVAVEWDGDWKVPVCKAHVEARVNATTSEVRA